MAKNNMKKLPLFAQEETNIPRLLLQNGYGLDLILGIFSLV